MTAAKAYAALAGSIATALLGVFTGDTLLGQILTVVSVVATAFATYQIPNDEPEPRRRRRVGSPGEGGHMTPSGIAAIAIGAFLGVLAVEVLIRLLG